ncbi:hypothetical protein OAJ55_00385 [Candidatus Nitrosopelagicus sp.]|nr:hypothetical protein [Candidatus Nitrosopelagicus sp.]
MDKFQVGIRCVHQEDPESHQDPNDPSGNTFYFNETIHPIVVEAENEEEAEKKAREKVYEICEDCREQKEISEELDKLGPEKFFEKYPDIKKGMESLGKKNKPL